MVRKASDYFSYDRKNQLISASLTGEESVEEFPFEGIPTYLEAGPEPLGQDEMEISENDLSLDWGARSLGIDLGYGYRVKKVELKPSTTSETRVNEINTVIYTSLYNQPDNWGEEAEYTMERDETTGNITIEFNDIQFARYIKIHSHFYKMDVDGDTDSNQSELTLDDTDPYEITIVSAGRNEFYSYDGAGNREKKTYFANGQFLTWDYEYIEGSNLIRYDGEYAYRYDGNGNMVEKGDSFSEDKTSVYQEGDYTNYGYDLFNRLVEVKKLNETTNEVETVAEYVYNVNGYRIRKTDGDGNTTNYVFDLEGKVLEESTATETYDYAYLGSKHLARMTDDETLYYGTDHLGSTILMTDETGEAVWTGVVTPFADQENVDGLDESVKYTGKDLDEDAGLYYFNARWYDPLNGRFITEDPVRDGLNWFVYVGNNPLRYVDPSGLYILQTRRSFNDFHMGSADLIWKYLKNNLGNSSTSVAEAGCFAVAYAREANAWQAYKLESMGETIQEGFGLALNNFVATFVPSENYSSNPGKEDEILRKTRKELFQNTMDADPIENIFRSSSEIGEALTTALSSENPYTLIGVVNGASGGIHAINIDGYDTESEIVSVYDTVEGPTTRYQLPVSSFLEVRTMTISENEE